MNDEDYMKQVLQLAISGQGYVDPNPLVAALVVKDGEIIGKGYHQEYGGFHAERNALLNTKNTTGATLYVNLEPCCHTGKTPPCTDIIIKSGINRVVIGTVDPNPLVSGKGITLLREHGISVHTGVLEAQCRALNTFFCHYMETGLPYVILKSAITLDGKTATKTGASRWITGETARKQVHHTRHKVMGIMVGVKTVISDDPMLTSRIENGKNPIRIICDSRLQTPFHSKVVHTAFEIPTILATCVKEAKRYEPYQKQGCKVLQVSEKDGSIDLRNLMKLLGKEGISSILMEAGGTLNEAAFRAGIVNKVHFYIAPIIFGGEKAPGSVGGVGIEHPFEAYQLKEWNVTTVGKDIFVEAEVKDVYRNC